MVVDALVVVAAVIPFLILLVLRSPIKLVLGQVDAKAAKVRVILQSGPRQWVVLVTHPEKAAEAQHRVGDLAGDFVDHHLPDASDFAPAGAIDHRAVNSVGRN